MYLNLFIVTCFVFFISIAHAHACPVTLKVKAKQQDVVLSHGGDIPKTYSVILIPTEAIKDRSETCEAYLSVNEVHMNNVTRADEVFKRLEEGDIIHGTLNYHRPSPYGKTLYDNFHYGFRLTKDKYGSYEDS